jgi:hypothetical protein
MASSDGAVNIPTIHKVSPTANKTTSEAIAFLTFPVAVIAMHGSAVAPKM